MSTPTDETLAARYARLGSVPAVARELGVAYETARQRLLSAGVQLTRKGRPSQGTDTLDVSKLVARYEAGASMAMLAEEFSISPMTVRSRLIEAGVEIRRRPGWKY